MKGNPTIAGGNRNKIDSSADPPASICGYATASQIGITILGTTYPRSFIVRTYSSQFSELGCYQSPRAFYFKVTHR